MSAATKVSITDFIQIFVPSIFESEDHRSITHVSPVKKDMTKATRGRPKCDEFEDEVFAECERSHLNKSNNTRKKRDNYYSYLHVKTCATTVMNTEYWDESSSSFVKKWQLNRTTNKLRFTNKWVYGVLRRRSTSHSRGYEDEIVTETQVDVECGSSISIDSSFISQPVNDSTVDAMLDNHVIDDLLDAIESSQPGRDSTADVMADDHVIDDLLDVLDSIPFNNESLLDSLLWPTCCSCPWSDVSLNDLLGLDFDWDL